MPDAKVIALKPKDHHSFESLLRPHLDTLYRVAYRFCGNTDDAEDLVQDLLLRLYPKVKELREVDRLRPWLIRVIYRMFIDRVRRNKRSPIQSLDTLTPANDDGMDPYQQIETETVGPQDSLHCSQEQKKLIRVLSQLGEKHRHIVVLHDVEGYTLEEMQEVFDCPIGTLKSRLHRARLKLRGLLAAEERTVRTLESKQQQPQYQAVNYKGYEANPIQQFQKEMDRQISSQRRADYACS